MTDTTASAEEHTGHVTGYGSKGYRTYVLVALMLIYTLNFIDRTLITVVAQPIMDSLSLSDGQFGFLSGPPFALFYAAMGIPIAMLADRSNRVLVIAVCIVVWSVMTALCGFAAGFLWLVIFRIGVAIGEAGGTPPANSIITDYYPVKSRANALGIYSMGVTLGGVLAQVFGGSIAGIKGADFGNWLGSLGLGGLFSGINWESVEGWRIAFVVVGAPGVLIAAILWMTVKEPPRGYTEKPDGRKVEKASFGAAFAEIGKKKTFWWGAFGAAFVAFVGYGLQSFQAPFLQRVYGIGVREAALFYGAPLSLCAAAGTFGGGFLSEKLQSRFHSVVAWLPAVGLMIAVPCYIGAFFAPTMQLTFILWMVAAFCHYSYLGAQYSIATSIASPRARATAVAVLLLMVSIIGNGIGPLFVGMMSDFFMGNQIAAAGLTEFAADFDSRACAGDPASLSSDAVQYCKAYGNGLRQSMAATALWFLLAAFCFFMAGKTFKKDQWSNAEPVA
ncbi:MAG: spinster family MFS transporter [Hyphomonas sp.]